jgi:hypothetical protein
MYRVIMSIGVNDLLDILKKLVDIYSDMLLGVGILVIF